MRDARVEQVDHVSDSDSEDREAENTQLTIGIFPSHQGPTYLLMPTKQDKVTDFFLQNLWLHPLKPFFLGWNQNKRKQKFNYKFMKSVNF